MEEIGKVRLDYSKYSGRDLYSDGAVEEELLEIVRTKPAEEYERIIGERASWPLLYHLSPQRENIVDWIPMSAGGMSKSDENGTGRRAEGETPDTQEREAVWEMGRRTAKVLEVGSGCGAITGALARKAKSVTCVELSKRRSMINAYRHRKRDNITIHVGNFKDIEPDLPKDFDFIFLTGVFEYGQAYIGGAAAYQEFLSTLLGHLAKDGRIIIAIENRYGLKYFAGCQEDHLGKYFSGIEGYKAEDGVRTFGRNGLEEVFRSCGVREYHFYYPYPDYKFMMALYSDDYLPGRGELCDNLRNFDSDRMLLFDEEKAFDGILDEGMFPLFSNSFLAVIGPGFDTKYVKYSNDRAPEFAVRTEISMSGPLKDVRVKKYPLSRAAQEHVLGMRDACESLTEKYKDGRLEVNRCRLLEEDGIVCAEFEFVRGMPLSELMRQCLGRGDREGFHEYFRQYVERVDYNREYPAGDLDLTFSNILVDGDRWTVIDYEWTFGKPIEIKELAFRSICCYLQENERLDKIFGRPELQKIWKELAVTEEESQRLWDREMEFQRFVAGKRMGMVELREKIGRRAMIPQDWIGRYPDSGKVNRVQIYEDKGQGYSEENSYVVREAYQGEGLIEMELKVRGDVNMLRIDPCDCPCMVKIKEMTFNGAAVPLDKRKMLYANGKIIRQSRKTGGRHCPGIVFSTNDPNINVGVGRLERRAENVLKVRLEVARLSEAMAGVLIRGTARGAGASCAVTP